MQFLKTTITILVLVLLFSCTNKKAFNFNKKWNWTDLEAHASEQQTKDQIKALKKIMPLKDARFLFKQLNNLEKHAQIRELSTIENKQKKWGGSFYGYIPDNFKDSTRIPIPDEFSSKINTALFLSKIRNKIFRIISRPDFKYTVKFKGDQIPTKPVESLGSDLNLEIDISAVQKVLDLYKNKKLSMDQALEIARHDVFQEMLKHRRNLGYIPEPLPDSTDLAKFIYTAGSNKPLYEIWNWLNPCNLFCFSDLYYNQDQFRDLLNHIDKNKKQLEYNIFNRIDNYIPKGTKFSDKLSFGVNFGVRSWATGNAVGTNIVQVKDDYSTLTKTMRHEVFHHVQLALCPISPDRRNKENLDFSDLTYWNFSNKKDRKFYKILSYIFLEGTATYVGGKPDNWIVFDEVKNSIGMLDQIYSANYEQDNQEMVDKIVNMGLQSNGPFYGLGYFMARTIEVKHGKEELVRAIKSSPLYFFKSFYDYRRKKPNRKFTHISDQVGDKILELYEKIKNTQTRYSSID